MRLAYPQAQMKILRHRQTRHFVALLVGCRCGRKFLHRLDRPMVACLDCGRVEDLVGLVAKVQAAREAGRRRAAGAARRAPQAARRARVRG